MKIEIPSKNEFLIKSFLKRKQMFVNLKFTVKPVLNYVQFDIDTTIDKQDLLSDLMLYSEIKIVS